MCQLDQDIIQLHSIEAGIASRAGRSSRGSVLVPGDSREGRVGSDVDGETVKSRAGSAGVCLLPGSTYIHKYGM